MPLIILSGLPCSGKSDLSGKLVEYFNQEKRSVILVSDEQKFNELKRNALYSSSSSEKQLRSWLKSEAERYLNNDTLVIIDAPNYIKGYRYELYCLSKERKTTHCVIECAAPKKFMWKRNQDKDQSLDRYSEEIFDLLFQRYEQPDSRNRWDSPLFVINYQDEIPFDHIEDALFKRKAPKPNLSTQTVPLNSSDFMYVLDNKTQSVIKLIITSIQNGKLTNIKVPGSKEEVHLAKSLSHGQLTRLRRQFINYIKMHSDTNIHQIETLFVQYINKSNV